jgi:tripartite-type tricarboxylate transporter receptor subunit TctC
VPVIRSNPALSERIVFAVLWMFFLVHAQAQQYPARPIRFITVGGDDAIPRIVAQVLSGQLGQQVFVEEHAGASGTIGAEVASRALADGYTFLVATSAHMVTHHFFKVNYDILRDFEPVSLLASYPFVLLAHPSLPVRTLGDLIKLAKANPGQLNYSATSAGSPTMLTFEMFKASAHVNIVHVPYKSVGAALIDVIAGQVGLCLTSIPSALPQVQAHQVRALAVSTPNRSVAAPDVPTFVEQGLPKVVSVAWSGLLAPAKMPSSIVARMNAEVVKALRKPEVRERILALAMTPSESTSDEFRANMKADLVKWAQAVKDANLAIAGQR